MTSTMLKDLKTLLLVEIVTKKFLGLFDVYFHVLTGRPIQKLSKVNVQATGFALDNDFRKRRIIHCLSLPFSCPSLSLSAAICCLPFLPRDAL